MTSYENVLGASVQAIIIDGKNPQALGEFYAKMLGGNIESDEYGGVSLSVSTLGFDIAFQEDEDYIRPIWPGTKGDQLQMLHLDIHVRNIDEAKAFALSIGATMPKEQFCQPDWDVQWITMLDPEGHPFCLWDA